MTEIEYDYGTGWINPDIDNIRTTNSSQSIRITAGTGIISEITVASSEVDIVGAQKISMTADEGFANLELTNDALALSGIDEDNNYAPKNLDISGVGTIISDDLSIESKSNKITLIPGSTPAIKDFNIYLLNSASDNFTSGVVSSVTRNFSYGEDGYCIYLEDGGFNFVYTGPEDDILNILIGSEFTLSAEASSSGEATLSAYIVSNSVCIKNVSEPVEALDAVNKNYVDNKVFPWYSETITDQGSTCPQISYENNGNYNDGIYLTDANGNGLVFSKAYGLFPTDANPSSSLRINSNHAKLISDYYGLVIGNVDNALSDSIVYGGTATVFVNKQHNDIYMHTPEVIVGQTTNLYGGPNVPGIISNVATPTEDDHAVNKAYVDTKQDLIANKTDTGIKLIGSYIETQYTITGTGSASGSFTSGVVTYVSAGTDYDDDNSFVIGIEDGGFRFIYEGPADDILSIPVGTAFTLSSPADSTEANTLTVYLLSDSAVISGVAAPVESTDAANKSYVDNKIIVSATVPENPVDGTIWIYPID